MVGGIVMKKQINLKVENTTIHKSLMSLLCVFLLVIFTWFYCSSDVINYKIMIVNIIGQLLVLCFWIKNISPLVYVNGSNIKYQCMLIPFIYRMTSFDKIKKIRMCTRITNYDGGSGGEPYDIMCFYSNKGRMFSISMNAKNAKKLFNIAVSYGVHIERDKNNG